MTQMLDAESECWKRGKIVSSEQHESDHFFLHCGTLLRPRHRPEGTHETRRFILDDDVGAGGGIRTHAAPKGHKLLGIGLSPGLLPT